MSLTKEEATALVTEKKAPRYGLKIRHLTREQFDANCEKVFREIAQRDAERDARLAVKAREKADRLRLRTPGWVNMAHIADVYLECMRLSFETGVQHHVDHIIPLAGDTVSGLHVSENLRITTAYENMRKGNRFS